jgi:putative salt-induced outer membrane protein
LQWRKDRFGGYATQFSQTIGYGNQLIDNNHHKLNAEIGAGARQSETQLGIEDQEIVGRLGLYYRWQFSDTAEFRQNLTTEVGKINTSSESLTSISAKLIGDLALVASYTIRNNSDVPILIKKTDTYTALSVEYLF